MSDLQIAKVVQDMVDATLLILSLCGMPVQIGHAILCLALPPFHDADATRFRNIGALGFAVLLALISSFFVGKSIFQCRRYKAHYRPTKIPTLGSLTWRLHTPVGLCIIPFVGGFVGRVGEVLLQGFNTMEMVNSMAELQQVSAVLAGFVGYSSCEIAAVLVVSMVRSCTAKAKKAMGIGTVKSPRKDDKGIKTVKSPRKRKVE